MMRLDEKTIIEDLIQLGFSENCIFFYGSAPRYIESGEILPAPNDIDVISFPTNTYPVGEYTIELEYLNIPVNINVMTKHQIIEEIDRGEVKYFTTFWTHTQSNKQQSAANYYDMMKHLHDKDRTYFREVGSRSSSKAFNKGKKKLTVPEDYDKLLGLKNLYHSVSFPVYIRQLVLLKEAGSNEAYNIMSEVMDHEYLRLVTFWDDLNEIYDSTDGNLLDKAKVVCDFAKVEHNRTMTEFRKMFPKEDQCKLSSAWRG